MSTLFDGILVEVYWSPGSHNAADLSSKYHNNLCKVLNSDFYRSGHASYSGDFPAPESILVATIHSGVLKYRGLSNLTNHTSICNHCSTEYGQNISEVLTFQTSLLGNSETNKNVPSDKSMVIGKNYDDILESSNQILNSKNCENISVGDSVRKSVLGKAV